MQSANETESHYQPQFYSSRWRKLLDPLPTEVMISVFEMTRYVGRISRFGYIHEDVLLPVLNFQGLYPLEYIRAVIIALEMAIISFHDKPKDEGNGIV